MLETYLFENRQQYQQMLQGLVDVSLISSIDRDNLIYSVRDTLKRNDRIVWWLKWWRLDKIHNLVMVFDWQKHEMTPEVTKLYKKYLKAIGVDESRLKDHLYNFRTDFIRRDEMIHMANSFETIPPTNDVVWGSQTPDELQEQLRDAEETYTRNFANSVDMDVEEAPWEKLIDYGDSAWVLLDKEYCKREGQAMGHCGNEPSVRPGDRILSYRTLRDKNVHQPHLTFILHKDGMLGEMKGRANQKPTQKYHPVIVDLLMNPIVNGIEGGGYAPASNFDLTDLDDDTAMSILEKKPSIMNIKYAMHYEMLDEEMVGRINRLLGVYDLGIGQEKPYFELSSHTLVLGSFDTDDMEGIMEYAELVRAPELEDAASMIHHQELSSLFLYLVTDDRVERFANEFTQHKGKRYYDAFNSYVASNYPEFFDTSEHEEPVDAVPDIPSLMILFDEAVMYGYSAGTEQKLRDEIKKILDNAPYVNEVGGNYILRLPRRETSDIITRIISETDGELEADADLLDDITYDYLSVSDLDLDSDPASFDSSAADEYMEMVLMEIPEMKSALGISDKHMNESLNRIKMLAGI